MVPPCPARDTAQGPRLGSGDRPQECGGRKSVRWRGGGGSGSLRDGMGSALFSLSLLILITSPLKDQVPVNTQNVGHVVMATKAWEWGEGSHGHPLILPDQIKGFLGAPSLSQISEHLTHSVGVPCPEVGSVGEGNWVS